MKAELKEKIYQFAGDIVKINFNHEHDYAEKERLMVERYSELETWIFDNIK